MYSLKIPTLLLILSLSACSSNKKPRPDAKVITHITEEGIKRFQVVLAREGEKSQRKSNKNQGRVQGQRPRSDRNGSSSNLRTEKAKKMNQTIQLSRRIEHILSRYGYCRDGFAEIDRYLESGIAYFNGQCNESASTEDRLKYINQ